MSTPTLGPRLTRADLDRMPDDGNRYELIEGEIVMAPAPRTRHQVVCARLFRLLDDARPAGTMVLFAPFDVVLDEGTVVEPDLVVFDEALVGERGIESPPDLVVEVLSPSTRRRDLVRKKRVYERAGVRSYWIVDPDDDEITFTAWDLQDGRYRVVAAIAGEEEWVAAAPYAVRVVPAQLGR